MMDMKKFLVMVAVLLTVATSCSANENAEPLSAQAGDGDLFNGKRVLVAYFSWGGTTRRMAEAIEAATGGDIFEIEPVVPYPTAYTPCTEVALEERDSDARPAIKDKVAGWDAYDIVFIGCPVWWHTAPMIISTFAESYDFAGKTVVPFCTYAATFRDETLSKIVDLTPAAEHLDGLGTTGSTSGVRAWIERISEQWVATHPVDDAGGIEAVPAGAEHALTAVYDLKGRRVRYADCLTGGVYIVSNADGSTRKILK